MAASLEITAHRGSLWIQPESLTGFLKPHLQYYHRYSPKEIVNFTDNNGVSQQREVRTNRVMAVKVNLYKEQDGYLVVHEGMLNKVLALCGESGFEVNYSKLDPQLPEPVISPSVVAGLMPDQVDCFVAAVSSVGSPGSIGGSGALIQATMGAGKTFVIAALCRAYRRKVVVTTKAKAVVRRLHKGLQALLADHGITVGIYQGETRIDGDIIVITDVLLDRLDPEEVDVLIYDECHHAAGDTKSVSVMRFDRAVKFGLSATITGRFDGREALLQAIFGPIIYELTDQEAEELGRVVPIKVFALQCEFGPKTTNWKSPVSQERYAIWRNVHRNQLIQRAAEKVPENQQLLVFVSTREHGEILQTHFLKGYKFYHGDLGDREQRELLVQFESGTLKRLIATDSIGEGVDPQDLMVVIDTNWKSSKTQVPQRAGRNRRHGSDKAWGVLVTFQDDFDDLTRRKSNERLQQYRKRGYQVTLIAHQDSIEFVTQKQQEQENGPDQAEGPGEPDQGCLPGIPREG